MGIPAKSSKKFRSVLFLHGLAFAFIGVIAMILSNAPGSQSVAALIGVAALLGGLGALIGTFTFTCPACRKSTSIFSLRQPSFCRSCGHPGEIKGFKRICRSCSTTRRYQRYIHCVYCGGEIFTDS